MNAISLKGRSVLGLQDFTAGEIERILEVAAQMKKIVLSDNKKRDFLKGKSIVTVFSEASTRTRSSFELAGKYLGADVINITKSGSSMTKGESMRDTLLTVSAMGVDAVIIRDSSEGAALFASKVMSPKVKVPVVINAGDGAHAHPTQALLELFTLKEAGKNIKGMKYVIIGDILHSRVARSDIYGFTKLGAEVHLVGPRTLVPKELESMGVIVDDNLEDALRDADAINILRIQLERAAGGFIPTTREYARLFGINKKRLELCKKDAAIIHPGPMNRGIEIGYDVAYDESSWIQEEVRNGVAVRMALEYLTLTEMGKFSPLAGLQIQKAQKFMMQMACLSHQDSLICMSISVNPDRKPRKIFTQARRQQPQAASRAWQQWPTQSLSSIMQQSSGMC